MTISPTEHYDVAVVGAGIVGLAHALAGARRGLRVVVFDREARAVGASVRNFGFVTVTGQQRGTVWERAVRSCAVWGEIVAATGLEVHQRGLTLVARAADTAAVLEELLGTEMGAGCELRSGADARAAWPMLRGPVQAVLWSPHELRVEPRVAIPTVAQWLASQWDVEFRHSTAVTALHRWDRDAVIVETPEGCVTAGHAVVCPGPDLRTLYPQIMREHRTTHCKLHMLRLAPQPGSWRLPTPLMTDLSILRYEGYAELPSARAASERLRREHPLQVDNGIHLIVVQAADGSLVVGDSHHYGDSPDPFQSATVDDLILDELHAVLAVPDCNVVERWTGVYPWTPDGGSWVHRPDDRIRVAMVTSGTGMSTAFGFAEEVISELLADDTAR